MKLSVICSILFLSFTVSVVAQEEIELSGLIQGASISQGGAELDTYDIPAAPLSNRTFVLIQLHEGRTPKKVLEFKTDSIGRFRVHLTPGAYGIVRSSDLNSLNEGQYLPESISTHGEHVSYSSFWEISTLGPIIIKDEAVKVIVTHQERNNCFTCP